jgi:putative membrane protein insertion efficiency factor
MKAPKILLSDYQYFQMSEQAISQIIIISILKSPMMPRSLIKGLLTCIPILLSASCYSQVYMFRSDIEQVKQHLTQQLPAPSKRAWIYKNEPSVIKRYNPLGLFLGGALYVYQNIFSKHISADCLFTPSCSEFGKQALKAEGLFRGMLLTIDRVNRCNRISGQDLKAYTPDSKTGRYPDPVSRYRKDPNQNAE